MAKDDVSRAIEAALERDREINLHASPVEIRREGDHYLLSGEVEHIAAKRRALQLAQEAAGAHAVLDRLRVRTPSRREDDELAQAVELALAEESVFRGFAISRGQRRGDEANWINITARDGCVQLEGQVWSLSHRRLAEVITWWIPGCQDVDNRLHVEPAERDSDAEITDAVRLVLDKESSLDATQVSARTRDREVYLEGVVRSEENKRIASYDCWYIPGVHAVHNHLEVRP